MRLNRGYWFLILLFGFILVASDIYVLVVAWKKIQGLDDTLDICANLRCFDDAVEKEMGYGA